MGAPVYWVTEIFETIQGEGWNTGLPMIFVRLAGCNAKCDFCDTPGSWDMHAGQAFAADDLLGRIKGLVPSWVCLTGGEPTLQDINYLSARIKKETGKRVAVETAGTGGPVFGVDWITLSPKPRSGQMPDSWWWNSCSEVKWLVGSMEDIREAEGYVAKFRPIRFALQPISRGQGATALCVRACIESGWRLSIQVHKYIEVR